jgi:Fe-S-cluster containining protein
VSDDHQPDDRKLVAGDFSVWADSMRLAIREQRASDVPCNGCSACCRSSQFVHIGPDETEALARIPTELLFPAPGRPRGHVVLGYDERGHCPMLIDAQCSIYEHRPNACRTYDCRVFPAAGLDPGEQKIDVSRRVRQWRFSYTHESDRTEHDAVRAAAAYLVAHPDLARDAGIPATETQLAVLAVEMHDLFLERDEETGAVSVAEPDVDELRAAVMRRASAS